MYESINLSKQRELHTNSSSKNPFQHQIESFDALNKVFQVGKGKSGSGILVLPTGAGKTFTAVRWLCRNVVPKNIKILWLAPSYYLLDQAAATFRENAREVPESRQTLNIRCVSSSPSHARASSIQLSDDVIFMTIPTAISNLNSNAKDKSNEPIKTAFRKFIENNQQTEFFVVIDEAHHTPAYGCRNLLIAEQDSLRSLIPNLHLLGLTATPTYTEKAKQGWLSKIFINGIIYQADKEKLILQGILARPNYIPAPTGKEMEVDDRLYDQLTNKHKDLPEEIIEILAKDKSRNNAIVNTYLAEKESYGKTIIFADRWYQCVYLKEQLIKKGIKADAIYSHIDADPNSAEARNKQTQNDNQRILKQFATKPDANNNHEPLDVLINVRMLTEGADVPSVQTVFITRQTKSQILMTQMIGRALRGPKAGGSSEANIVLFFDEWKRLVDWADPVNENGGTEETLPSKRERYPLEYISIRLVEELAKSFENGGEMLPFSKIFPVGWYKTQINYGDADEIQESTDEITEFVMVYEHTLKRFQDFINFISEPYLSDEWSKEYLEPEWIKAEIQTWVNVYFDDESDNIGEKLNSSLAKIVRHIAQNESIPEFHSFEDRHLYDVDKLAQKIIDLSLIHHSRKKYLEEEFSKANTLWKTFCKSFKNFETAVHASEMKIIDGVLITPDESSDEERMKRFVYINDEWKESMLMDTDVTPIISPLPVMPVMRELTEKEKRQVKERDGKACLCCGASGKGVKLQVDHVFPFSLGGKTNIENSQTLCSICNKFKGKNEIDFRSRKTFLKQPKEFNSLDFLSLTAKDQDINTQSLTRIINFFYNCNAVTQINWHQVNSAKYYKVWEIYLHSGNDPEWLLFNKSELLELIHNYLGCPRVEDVKILDNRFSR